MIDLKIKKLHPDAVIPHYATDGSAGLDLICTQTNFEQVQILYPRSDAIHIERVLVCHTGLACEIPKGYVGLLFPRSSVSKKPLTMANSVGVIDSDYRGEIMAKFYIRSDWEVYHKGDRCCQLVLMKLPEVNIVEVEDLSDTERGTGGFGSTGK